MVRTSTVVIRDSSFQWYHCLTVVVESRRNHNRLTIAIVKTMISAIAAAERTLARSPHAIHGAKINENSITQAVTEPARVRSTFHRSLCAPRTPKFMPAPTPRPQMTATQMRIGLVRSWVIPNSKAHNQSRDSEHEFKAFCRQAPHRPGENLRISGRRFRPCPFPACVLRPVESCPRGRVDTLRRAATVRTPCGAAAP